MEPPPGFEPGPVEYKSTDLPVNRQRHERRRPTVRRHPPEGGAGIRTRISGSLERYTRLELVYADWQSAVLATGRIPQTQCRYRFFNAGPCCAVSIPAHRTSPVKEPRYGQTWSGRRESNPGNWVGNPGHSRSVTAA